MLARIFTAALACGFASAAFAQGTEWLAQAPLPDLVVAHRQEQAGSMIEERIPPGETVNDWTRMVTTQRFAGLVSRGVTLDSFVASFVTGLDRGCPGARSSEPRHFETGGRPAVSFRIDCPLNPATGKPETFLLLAIAGREDLHVVQVAYRHVPDADENQAAERHLASIRLCSASSPDPACRH